MARELGGRGPRPPSREPAAAGRHLLPGARASWSATPASLVVAAGRSPRSGAVVLLVAGRAAGAGRARSAATLGRHACSPRSRWCSRPLAVQGTVGAAGRAPPRLRARCSTPGGPGRFRLAAVALVAAVVLLWYALLRRRIGAGGADRSAALVWLAVLAAVLAAVRAGRLLPGRLAGPGRRGGRPRRGRDTSSRVRAGGRRAGRGRGRRRRPRADRRRCSSRRSACPSRRRAGVRRHAAGASRCCPRSSCCSPTTRRAERPGRRGGGAGHRRRRSPSALRRRGPARRPLRRAPPGAEPAGLRAGRRHRPGVVGEHRGRSRARTPRSTCEPAATLPVDFPYLDGREVWSGRPSRPTCRAPEVRRSRTPCVGGAPASDGPGRRRSGPASGCWPSSSPATAAR